METNDVSDIRDMAESLLENTSEQTSLNNNTPMFNSGNSDALLNNSGLNQTYIILMYLIIIVSIVVVLYFVRKILLKNVKGINGSNYMRIYDRMIISQDKQIAMIELSDKILIVGITNHGIQHLYTMSKEECKELEDKNNNAAISKFGSILSNTINNTVKGKNEKSNEVREEKTDEAKN